ncbi:hypothetical protein JDW19_02490 [Paenibacillus polymyxa]|uniref:Uncharacterized protein n=1 Tax=Paenibacillus polymyxa TaxID=1406 RepID=A0A8I1ILL7_PAEPO|nr:MULTISPECIES: hypothetical protein [Paenibacillus]KAF6576558.1 hypothetical protein G9G53_01205 [Paenibacillus sp. EKM206P]KAF6591308.1 hypothetical protein G9G52_02760 [Paenibacillus sp. EKM205P]MBM0631997.1 hypothetical protein [Paenibacillus polymyxa]
MSVKDMTAQQLNRELAELMGYTVEKEATGGYALKYNGEDQGKRWMRAVFAWEQAPDYCTDPAASLEVQAKALKECPEEYIQELLEIVCGIVYVDTPSYRIAELLAATPRQRVEAAYMTLSSHPLREDI